MNAAKQATAIDIESEAFREAGEAGRSGVAGIIDRLADRVGATAGAGAVFGEPVKQGGRTVIPVAQSIWGGGAGSGESENEGTGSGGGAGAMTRPLGYIEISEHETAFVPLQQPWQDARLIIAYAIAIWLISRALNRILRG